MWELVKRRGTHLNILVTGSNGPLGTYLIRKLTNTFNDCEVFALSRGKYVSSLDNVKYFTHDLKKDIFTVNQAFDIVIHAAAAVPVITQNKKDFSLVNLEGSIRLFENLILNENAFSGFSFTIEQELILHVTLVFISPDLPLLID